MPQPVKHLRITSNAFFDQGDIPAKYTCNGSGIRPAMHIDNIPAGTKSLAIIIEDPDAPNGTFTHLINWNIPPVTDIEEGASPGISGKNDFGKNGYGGPCPPSGTHHYHFDVFALDTELPLSYNADKQELKKAMHGHILAEGELIGLYSHKK